MEKWLDYSAWETDFYGLVIELCIKDFKMKIKMRRLIFVLATTLFSCSSNEEKWKKIDAETFTADVPDYFKYEKKDGIDSQFGEITGDSLKIYFDYGCYTDEEPRTNEEFAEKMLFHIGMIKETLKQLNIPDTFNIRDLIEQFKVEKLDTTSWIASIKYQDTLIFQPITMYWYDEEDDRRNYLFEIDSIGDWRRKIFYPKNKSAKRSGIVLRGKFNKTIGNNVALGLSIYNGQTKDSAKIIRILKSIRIKE